MAIQVDAILSDQAEEMYSYLLSKSLTSKIEKGILDAVKNTIELIRADPFYGEPIVRHTIPNFYKDKYQIENLYRVVLPNYWRMLYSLADEEIRIIALIIDVTCHPDFGSPQNRDKNSAH